MERLLPVNAGLPREVTWQAGWFMLAAVKEARGHRVANVPPRQGQYPRDAEALALFIAPDLTVDRIGDLCP
jgi:hypothetical protein